MTTCQIRTTPRHLDLLGPALPSLLALAVAVLPLGAPRAAAAAQQTSTAIADSSARITSTSAGGTTAPETGSESSSTATGGTPAALEAGVESSSTPPSAVAPVTPEPAPGIEKAAAPLSSGTSITAGMPIWKLLVVDARSVFTAPANWTGRDWGLFSLEVAALVGIGTADRTLQRDVLGTPAKSSENDFAETVRPLGTYASFGVLGGFYLGGLIAHDARAQETAVDGLIASGLAAGVITPVLKEIVGRTRPSAHQGTYDFHPFRGSASFPSGESTQAFAVASVISAEYPNVWVEGVSYALAGLVGYARMRENAHFASDVLAGALIGNGVGRAVVRINKRLRARVTVAPLIGPHEQGLTIVSGF
jgi:membrane-associated phospholipid phosphatase